MHSSRQPYLLSGILICLLLCTEPSGTGAGPSPLASSSDPAQPQPTIPMLDEGKGIIHLDVSVINAEGEPVSGLEGREDFALLDEGRPQKIASFHAFGAQAAAPDPPAQVILFVDTLGLSSDKAFRMEVSIETFLRQNSGHLAQPASIFGLSEDGFWTVAQHAVQPTATCSPRICLPEIGSFWTASVKRNTRSTRLCVRSASSLPARGENAVERCSYG